MKKNKLSAGAMRLSEKRDRQKYNQTNKLMDIQAGLLTGGLSDRRTSDGRTEGKAY